MLITLAMIVTFPLVSPRYLHDNKRLPIKGVRKKIYTNFVTLPSIHFYSHFYVLRQQLLTNSLNEVLKQ